MDLINFTVEDFQKLFPDRSGLSQIILSRLAELKEMVRMQTVEQQRLDDITNQLAETIGGVVDYVTGKDAEQEAKIAELQAALDAAAAKDLIDEATKADLQSKLDDLTATVNTDVDALNAAKAALEAIGKPEDPLPSPEPPAEEPPAEEPPVEG